MSKHRVYELAKEFNTSSKVIIDILNRNNMPAKNHMSSVSDDARNVIERTFARKTGSEHTASTIDKPQKTISTEVASVVEQAKPQETVPQSSANLPQHQRGQKPPQQSHNRDQSAARLSSDNEGASKPTPHYPFISAAQRNAQNQNRPMHNNNRPHNAERHGQPTSHVRPPQTGGNVAHTPSAAQPPRKNPQGGFVSSGPRPNNNAPRPPQNTSQPPSSDNRRRFDNNQPSHSTPPSDRKDRNNRYNANDGKGFNASNQRRPQKNSQQGSNRTAAPAAPAVKPEPPKPKLIKVGESISVKDLASKFGREVGEIIKKLMLLGVMATINQEVDFETASILGSEFGIAVEELPPEEDPTEIPEIEDAPETLQFRPPVVTVMGHVDHGKTSLLDAIRQTNVTSHEAGGITQHIGAYQVNYQGKRIVFLDTPGHEAFTAMRARGAQVTDVAILVVAADDGVMPQTIEAINHAKAANVPIIVAVNKIDRPGAMPERVKQQLTEHGLIAEEWGGDAIMVEVSAHQKTGITDLLEMILLVAEMQDLKANPNRPALGTIIEAELDKGRGPVATVLVQKGTLRIGDTIIAGTAYGKVRAMVNDRGDKVKKAEPSTPVEVLGLSDVPQAGDILAAVEERVARAIAEKRIAKKRSDDMQQSQKVSLDDLFQQIQDGNIKDLNIVIKADVQGSIEALRQALAGLKNKEVRVNLIHAGVGAINESDVMLASAANALIIGFNVRPDANARKAAETEKVDLRSYRVIYDAINDVEAALTGMLAPEYKEAVLGRAEVRKVFSIPKAVVAGSYVTEGKITNASQVRLIRNGIVIHEGVLEALRRFKDDVKEVAAGYECGISIERFRDIKEGDIIEAFIMETVKPGN